MIPLYIIIAITPLSTPYYVVFAFLSSKTVDDYRWVLGAVKKLYKFLDIPDPKAIITNANYSIICAILAEFSFASYLLCFWYMNKNIMANCKKLFEDEESGEEFHREWYQIVYVYIKQEFIERWDVMKQKYEDHLGFPTYYIEDEIIPPHWHKLICYYTN